MRPTPRLRFKATLLASLVALSVIAAPVGASAAEDSDDAPITAQQLWTAKSVVNHSKSASTGSEILATCTVGVAGGTCTITSGKSATRTIGLTFGATRGEIATGLNISSANTQTISVSCTSPALGVGKSWRAKPQGTTHSYKIREVTYVDAVVVSSRTSGVLTAFNPTPNAIYCY